MTTADTPRRRRLRLIVVLATVIAVAIGAAVFFVVRSIPDYRTALLVDTSATSSSKAASAGGFKAISSSVSAAAMNAGDEDALSLRRFGGACGAPDNTAEIVGSGTGHGQQISNAVRTLTPSGRATLRSGILAAIDDFSSRYPFRGSKRNRIIVVTANGTDACTDSPTRLTKAIRDRIDAAGLRLDFRFVGYQVPETQQDALTQVASASRAPEPSFVHTTADLTATLKEFTIPSSPEAKPVDLPSLVVPVTACQRLGSGAQGLKPPPSSVRLPAQVRLPPKAQVFAPDPDTYLIGPKSMACEVSIGGSGGGVGVYSNTGYSIRHYLGGGASQHAAMACYHFGKFAPELAELSRSLGVTACKDSDDGTTQNIPTGTSGFYVGTAKDTADVAPPNLTPGTFITAQLRTLDIDKDGVAHKSISCTLPREQADICTAALTYFFVQRAAKTTISSADLGRVSKAISTYVDSVKVPKGSKKLPADVKLPLETRGLSGRPEVPLKLEKDAASSESRVGYVAVPGPPPKFDPCGGSAGSIGDAEADPRISDQRYATRRNDDMPHTVPLADRPYIDQQLFVFKSVDDAKDFLTEMRTGAKECADDDKNMGEVKEAISTPYAGTSEAGFVARVEQDLGEYGIRHSYYQAARIANTVILTFMSEDGPLKGVGTGPRQDVLDMHKEFAKELCAHKEWTC